MPDDRLEPWTADNGDVTYPLRADPYYAGTLNLVVVADEVPGNPPRLQLYWAPYEGGSVILDITRSLEFPEYDEALQMRDALTKIIDAWPSNS